MLSLFPQILFLAPAGTALLRIAAGITFIYWGYFYWTHLSDISGERLPIVGEVPAWLVSIGALLSAATGVLLLVGLWTQAAAIVGALGALKSIVLGKRYPEVFPFPRSASLLLLVICLSLVVSGAGAFAFDFPL